MSQVPDWIGRVANFTCTLINGPPKPYFEFALWVLPFPQNAPPNQEVLYYDCQAHLEERMGVIHMVASAWVAGTFIDVFLDKNAGKDGIVQSVRLSEHQPFLGDRP